MKKLLAMIMTIALAVNIMVMPVAVSETRADEVLRQLRGMSSSTGTSETAAEESKPGTFKSGYVRVTGMTKIYAEPNDDEHIGQFTAGGVAWGIMTEEVNEEGTAWIKIVFDTMEASEAGAEFITAYVLKDRVAVLDEDATYDIRLEYQRTARKYSGYPLPQVKVSMIEAVTFVEETVTEVVLANAPVITTQPDGNIAAARLDWVTLSVVASNAESYRWQYKTATGTWTNMKSTWEGYNTDTVRFQMTTTKFGYSYRCAVTGGGTTVYSDEVTIQDKANLVCEITTQPDGNIAAARLDWVTLSVEAVNADSYQWQYKTATGAWTNMKSTWEGYNTNSVRFQMTASKFSYSFRCAVTGNGNTVYSDEVQIANKADMGPVITTQPDSTISAARLDWVTLTVEATNAETYRWQYKTATGDWTNMKSTWEGYNTNTVRFQMTASKFTYTFRCVITGNEKTVYSDEVTIADASKAKPEIITQPDSTISAARLEWVTLSVEATNAETYRWQYKTATGDWTDMRSTWEGYNTDTVRFQMTSSKFAYTFRCAVTGNDTRIYSDEVTIANKADVKLEIVTQPAGYAADRLDTVTLSVVATGAVSYKWQYKTPTADWANMTSTWEGYNTDTVSFTITAGKFNYVYRCEITGANETIYTDEVMFTRNGAPVITEQPAGSEVCVGEEGTLSVTATGAETYLWQYKAEGGSWQNAGSSWTGYNTASLTITMDEAAFGYSFRCVVTGNGMTVYSAEASFTKGQALTILDKDVLYTIDYEKNTLTITSYSGTASSLEIPETLQGFTVTEVGTEAFMGNTALESIDLPDTIEVIGDRAFMNCSNLKSMT